ncbi:flagellar motor protein [Ameyamaea chiangmaiensis NBRC 103196]|uniref:Peptidoglycan -binding protein n=1 Tax=Ameyamaea chiangmaiensis TaxID=442969 RepID=A0A850PJY3_9PROT|nr:peptidoglycan -binding protein [Ameyamaea chiangmaiensis]MBS4074896.1 peptidoglycan -binding protein [Ameyamaea chiangmaiensis]NVN42092.1 peptidoglycan -binding protein [Ameyamaea chiangmaiensis]GBQ63142.1 flagellar motor protein [Ameyamaea chiangmaiensis NBRC 103196]
MARRRRFTHGGLDVWPGYVDALSTLLMVVTFVLLVFVLGQAFLSVSLDRRQHTLDQLQHQMAELTRMLALERGHEHTLELTVASITAERDKTQAALKTLGAQLDQRNQDLGEQAANSRADEDEIARLNDQMIQLNQQLAAVVQTLDIAQKDVKGRDAQISDLGNRLNIALADRVEQLKKYRSEFFGRLRDILHDEKGVQVVGDRFVFQSEVLFPQGSADLSPAGQAAIQKLAHTLKQVATQIPADLPWILRVDGHADRTPIHGAFASNWELSSARAITVVKVLIGAGIDPRHLAATGFADYQPLDTAQTPAAFARNRRIEFRLTDR